MRGALFAAEKLGGIEVVGVIMRNNAGIDIAKLDALAQTMHISVGAKVDKYSVINNGLTAGSYIAAALFAGPLAGLALAKGRGNGLGRGSSKVFNLHSFFSAFLTFS
jgi:hypothetical protein